MASLVGLVMGGIQSLGRSTYSKFLPKTEDTTSFFSFYDVSEKVGIVIGMMIYGLIDQITGSPRFAIVFLGVFFLIAFLLLLFMNDKEQKNKINRFEIVLIFSFPIIDIYLLIDNLVKKNKEKAFYIFLIIFMKIFIILITKNFIFKI
jgi:MFS family permease